MAPNEASTRLSTNIADHCSYFANPTELFAFLPSHPAGFAITTKQPTVTVGIAVESVGGLGTIVSHVSDLYPLDVEAFLGFVDFAKPAQPCGVGAVCRIQGRASAGLGGGKALGCDDLLIPAIHGRDFLHEDVGAHGGDDGYGQQAVQLPAPIGPAAVARFSHWIRHGPVVSLVLSVHFA